jgi:sigma-E factor negative regulatory protein RseB
VIARRAVCVAVIAAGVGVATGVHAWAAQRVEPGPSPQDPLTTAREAVTKSTFTGIVRVQWFDGEHHHTQRVEVDDNNGLLVVGTSRGVMTDGETGLVRESDGWAALGADTTTQSGPAPTDNYRFSTLADEVVAGRSTRVVEAVQLHGTLRERFFLDRETGVLLRREQIESGRTVRTVEFVTISPLQAAAPPPPTHPRPRHRAVRVSTTKLGRGWDAPRALGNGFELVDAYRRSDGSLQLYYSDGLHGMSVFEQRGRLAHDAFPGGGHDATLSGHRVRVYDNAGGRTIVWDTGRAVYACVTDAPPGAVGTLLTKLPAHRGRGTVAGVMHFVLAPFSWE